MIKGLINDIKVFQNMIRDLQSENVNYRRLNKLLDVSN